MKFSLVFISYNSADAVAAVLRSVSCQSYDVENIEVVLVDDGSTPKLIDRIDLSAHAFPISYIYLDRNSQSCRARARNAGAKIAKGEYLIFLDGDGLLNPNLIEQYDRYFRIQRTREVVLGSRKETTRAESAALIEHAKTNTLEMSRLSEIGAVDSRCRMLKENGNVQLSRLPGNWVMFVSCNFAIKKTLFDSTNGFDETFKGWGIEDTELGYRLSQKNKKFDLIDNPSFHLFSHDPHWTPVSAYRQWLTNLGKFFQIHQDERILLLANSESLMYHGFLEGAWSYERHKEAFYTFSDRCRFLDEGL